MQNNPQTRVTAFIPAGILSVFFMMMFFVPAFAAADGSSVDAAIVIRNISQYDACLDAACLKKEYGKSIDQEYSVELPILFGVRNRDWRVLEQTLFGKENRFYDELTIRLKNGEEKKIYFDVTEPVKILEAELNKKGIKGSVDGSGGATGRLTP